MQRRWMVEQLDRYDFRFRQTECWSPQKLLVAGLKIRAWMLGAFEYKRHIFSSLCRHGIDDFCRNKQNISAQQEQIGGDHP